MNCTLSDGSPWAGASSMAIDRSAVAWVTDRNGLLFQVSTADASCRATSFHPQGGFTRVGMGFAGDADAGTETLYVADSSDPSRSGAGLGLATIDLGSMTLTPIANFGGPFAGWGAELTGTGDGHLYGFFPLNGPSVAEIDPATAAILSSNDVSVAIPTSGSGEFDFAVSFWGGVFFIYVAWTGSGATPTTDVFEFDPASQQSTLVLPQVGFDVVGAGSSTCAPLVGAIP